MSMQLPKQQQQEEAVEHHTTSEDQPQDSDGVEAVVEEPAPTEVEAQQSSPLAFPPPPGYQPPNNNNRQQQDVRGGGRPYHQTAPSPAAATNVGGFSQQQPTSPRPRPPAATVEEVPTTTWYHPVETFTKRELTCYTILWVIVFTYLAVMVFVIDGQFLAMECRDFCAHQMEDTTPTMPTRDTRTDVGNDGEDADDFEPSSCSSVLATRMIPAATQTPSPSTKPLCFDPTSMTWVSSPAPSLYVVGNNTGTTSQSGSSGSSSSSLLSPSSASSGDSQSASSLSSSPFDFFASHWLQTTNAVVVRVNISHGSVYANYEVFRRASLIFTDSAGTALLNLSASGAGEGHKLVATSSEAFSGEWWVGTLLMPAGLLIPDATSRVTISFAAGDGTDDHEGDSAAPFLHLNPSLDVTDDDFARDPATGRPVIAVDVSFVTTRVTFAQFDVAVRYVCIVLCVLSASVTLYRWKRMLKSRRQTSSSTAEMMNDDERMRRKKDDDDGRRRGIKRFGFIKELPEEVTWLLLYTAFVIIACNPLAAANSSYDYDSYPSTEAMSNSKKFLRLWSKELTVCVGYCAFIWFSVALATALGGQVGLFHRWRGAFQGEVARTAALLSFLCVAAVTSGAIVRPAIAESGSSTIYNSGGTNEWYLSAQSGAMHHGNFIPVPTVVALYITMCYCCWKFYRHRRAILWRERTTKNVIVIRDNKQNKKKNGKSGDADDDDDEAPFYGQHRATVLWLRMITAQISLLWLFWGGIYFPLMYVTTEVLPPAVSYSAPGPIICVMLTVLACVSMWLIAPREQPLEFCPPNPADTTRTSPLSSSSSRVGASVPGVANNNASASDRQQQQLQAEEPRETEEMFTPHRNVVSASGEEQDHRTRQTETEDDDTDDGRGALWMSYSWSYRQFNTLRERSLSGFAFDTEEQRDAFTAAHAHLPNACSFFCWQTAVGCLNVSEEVYRRVVANSSDSNPHGAEVVVVPHEAGCFEGCLGGCFGCACNCCSSNSKDDQAEGDAQDDGNGGRPPGENNKALMNVQRHGFVPVKCVEVHGVRVLISTSGIPTSSNNEEGPGAGAEGEGEAYRSPQVVLAFRGTANLKNALTDITIGREVFEDMRRAQTRGRKEVAAAMARRRGSRVDPAGAGGCCGGSDGDAFQVHGGFSRAWNVLRGHLLEHLEPLFHQLTSDGVEFALVCTGHSLGGAMASMAAYSAKRGIMSEKLSQYSCTDVVCYTFGMPRVGNSFFIREYNAAVPETYRIVNENDSVAFLGHCNRSHIGRLVHVDRHGNAVVDANTLEEVFEPLHGRGASTRNHIMDRYANAFERALRFRGLLPSSSQYHSSHDDVSRTTTRRRDALALSRKCFKTFLPTTVMTAKKKKKEKEKKATNKISSQQQLQQKKNLVRPETVTSSGSFVAALPVAAATAASSSPSPQLQQQPSFGARTSSVFYLDEDDAAGGAAALENAPDDLKVQLTEEDFGYQWAPQPPQTTAESMGDESPSSMPARQQSCVVVVAVPVATSSTRSSATKRNRSRLENHQTMVVEGNGGKDEGGSEWQQQQRQGSWQAPVSGQTSHLPPPKPSSRGGLPKPIMPNAGDAGMTRRQHSDAAAGTATQPLPVPGRPIAPPHPSAGAVGGGGEVMTATVVVSTATTAGSGSPRMDRLHHTGTATTTGAANPSTHTDTGEADDAVEMMIRRQLEGDIDDNLDGGDGGGGAGSGLY